MAQENDIVLIYYENNPVVFARIEDVSPDVKKDWYLVKLLLLQVPLQTVTWILRDRYILGDEFTMNGKRMRLERVVCPEEEDTSTEQKAPQQDQDASSSQTNSDDSKENKVISLADRRKQ